MSDFCLKLELFVGDTSVIFFKGAFSEIDIYEMVDEHISFFFPFNLCLVAKLVWKLCGAYLYICVVN